MRPEARRRAATAIVLAAATAALGACGGGETADAGGGDASKGVTVYSSLPMQGASKDTAKSIENSIKLAFAESDYRPRGIKIDYRPLDNSTAQAGGWDPQQTAANARKVAQDESTLVYLAEYNSGAAAVSIPITNEVGLTQLSATNSYVGLTTNEPGSTAGEPGKYYPSGERTFFRVAPRDSIQSRAGVTLMRQDGCTKVAVANDKETYGLGLTRGIQQEADAARLEIVSNEGIEKTSANHRAYAASLGGKGADCFYFAGITANGAVQLMNDVASALPDAKLYGSDGICESGFLSLAKGGVPAGVAKRVKCTVATLDLESYPGGSAYLSAYRAAYGDETPDPWSIYWYEAAKLVADTIAEGGTDRESFRAILRGTEDRESVLGRYSFDENGDSTLTTYAVYGAGPGGTPRFVDTVTAEVG